MSKSPSVSFIGALTNGRPGSENYPPDLPEYEEDNKNESLGLRGSNKVMTKKTGGPFPAEKYGRGVVDYSTGYKQTTIDTPMQGYTPDMDFSK